MYETSRLVRISLLIISITKKKVIKAIENFFPVFCILTLEGLGKFLTVMQALDFILGLHNCLEFPQPLSCLYQAMQTMKTFSIA